MPTFDIYTPSEEHGLLRDTVRSFVQAEVEPQAEAHDENQTLNKALLRKCGELGLLGVTVDEKWGGVQMDSTAAVIIHHELSRSDPGFCLAYLAHSMLFVNNFYLNATDDQRRRYLPKVLTGEHIGAMAMTEPSAGTDVLGMKTTAVQDGDHYVLNGAKTFITNGPEADLTLVYAKVQGRITAFVVEDGTPGFIKQPKIPKMGMRASTMCELNFDDCRVPAANLLGA